MVEKLSMEGRESAHILQPMAYHCHSSAVIHQHNAPNILSLNNNLNNNNSNNNNNNNNTCVLGNNNNNVQKTEFPPAISCAGCTNKIQDRYYLVAVDQQWHTDCLRCSECRVKLECELTCFAKDGKIYCKDDYYRRFAVKRCSRCHHGISSNELVMRAKDLVYHLHCFLCEACGQTLSPGEQFGLRDGLVFCRSHYEQVQGDFLGMSPELHGGILSYYADGPVKQRRNKRKSPEPCGGTMGMTNENLDNLMDRSEFGLHPPPRQKRMRTSFKHHQLRTMKTYFGLNHNPDAKDLKQLAQKTGLTKRVLQVWFQNARAKYRRNLLRQEQDNLRTGSTPEKDEKLRKELEELNQEFGPAGDNPGTPMSDISSNDDESMMGGICGSVSADSANESGSISDLFSSSLNSLN